MSSDWIIGPAITLGANTRFIHIGLCDLLKIGLGPSSSHTVGPMKAAGCFVRSLDVEMQAIAVRLIATAYGSLAWTGKGHNTDKALILGLAGYEPHTVDPQEAEAALTIIAQRRAITLPSGRLLPFRPEHDIDFDFVKRFPRHPNALTFSIIGPDERLLSHQLWYSIGGGFIERDGAPEIPKTEKEWPYPFLNAGDLLALGRSHRVSIAEIALAHERITRPDIETFVEIERIIDAMFNCIDRGLGNVGELPGGLKVKRRARALFEGLQSRRLANSAAASEPFDYVSAYAIAVNEENASGSRVVTAPTNGAAGVMPAVLRYYRDFCVGASREGMRTFILTATAIGSVIKRNASVSGAEVGCQGEVGSAAAMAAAGLVAALGGTNEQVENAAEIAIEHHLGMTCDPVGGLVQIPCIERNAFGAIKAINAASLALAGDGEHRVSLDQAIETMRQTGADMNDKYRETSRGGLAVNVPAC